MYWKHFFLIFSADSDQKNVSILSCECPFNIQRHVNTNSLLPEQFDNQSINLIWVQVTKLFNDVAEKGRNINIYSTPSYHKPKEIKLLHRSRRYALCITSNAQQGLTFTSKPNRYLCFPASRFLNQTAWQRGSTDITIQHWTRNVGDTIG